MSDSKVYVLTYEHSDKSGCYICGVTDNYDVAMAWRSAGITAENKVYGVTLNDIADASAGHSAWVSK